MKLEEKEINEIYALKISKRAQNILIRNSISKKMLFLMSMDEIKKIKGIGSVIMNEMVILFKENNILDLSFVGEKEHLNELRKIIVKELFRYLNCSNKEILSFMKNAIKTKIDTSSRTKLIGLKCELFEK